VQDAGEHRCHHDHQKDREGYADEQSGEFALVIH